MSSKSALRANEPVEKSARFRDGRAGDTTGTTASTVWHSNRRTQMKIAFTTSGETLDAPLDIRFGRAPKFLVYDTDQNTFDVIDNRQSLNAAQGAGIQAAETVARSGVNSLVTGYCGPKAFRVLSAAGITVYCTEAPTVAAALKAFRAGTLKRTEAADAEAHWA
jgi:predicted Fe-Mo cluster-binding NifX family protein